MVNAIENEYKKMFNVSYLKNIINSNSEVNFEYIRQGYRHLKNNYRNEYYFKNTIFNKMVLGSRSLNTTFVMNEVLIKNSKADFVLINNKKSFAIEIKTDLDNLERLIYQISDYYRVFSFVYVIVSEKFFYQVYKLLKDTDVGILVLNKNESISVRKEAKQNDNSLKHLELFNLLRKNEYKNIIKSCDFEVSNYLPSEEYDEYLKFFKRINIITAQQLVFMELKKRNKKDIVELINKVPYELKWFTYTSNLNLNQQTKLFDFINRSD